MMMECGILGTFTRRHQLALNLAQLLLRLPNGCHSGLQLAVGPRLQQRRPRGDRGQLLRTAFGLLHLASKPLGLLLPRRTAGLLYQHLRRCRSATLVREWHRLLPRRLQSGLGLLPQPPPLPKACFIPPRRPRAAPRLQRRDLVLLWLLYLPFRPIPSLLPLPQPTILYQRLFRHSAR